MSDETDSPTFWDSIKSDYSAFDTWSASVFSGVGNAILHPISTTVDAAGTVIAPVANFASSLLWKVIIIAGLALVAWFIFKDEIKEMVHG